MKQKKLQKKTDRRFDEEDNAKELSISTNVEKSTDSNAILS